MHPHKCEGIGPGGRVQGFAVGRCRRAATGGSASRRPPGTHRRRGRLEVCERGSARGAVVRGDAGPDRAEHEPNM